MAKRKRTPKADPMPILWRGRTEQTVTLTDEQRAARGVELAVVLDEIDAHRERIAEARGEFKAARKELEGRRDTLRRTVRAGKERLEIEVEDRADYALGIARRIRVDDGTEIERRALTDTERQVPLPMPTEAVADELAGIGVLDFDLPLAGGATWRPPPEVVQGWRRTFRNVDLPLEFRLMRAWLNEDTEKRLTPPRQRGKLKSWVESWLTRAANKRMVEGPGDQPPASA